MDLKFTFGGASPDRHDHGEAPSGIPLPFSTTPATSSSVLELKVRRGSATDQAAGPEGWAPADPAAIAANSTRPLIVAEAVSGDGVVYTSATVLAAGEDPGALARAVRSAASRAVAALEGPLAASITTLTVALEPLDAHAASDTPHGAVGAAVLAELGIAVTGSQSQTGTITDALQRRIGVSAGIPIVVV